MYCFEWRSLRLLKQVVNEAADENVDCFSNRLMVSAQA